MAVLLDRIASSFASKRALIGAMVFEFSIVFVGVTAAFGMESFRRDREEAAYRSGIIAALIPTLDYVLLHNRDFETEVEAKLAAFDAAIARREQPALPMFRERDSERPPVRIWDSVVATGAARALEPDLLFRLSVFYNRQDSFGERYVRYAAYTEERILTLGSDRAAIYDGSGTLRPAYSAYVDRLRDLVVAHRDLAVQARTLRAELQKRGQIGR